MKSWLGTTYVVAVAMLAALVGWWLWRLFESPLTWIACAIVGWAFGSIGLRIWYWSQRA